MFRKAAQSFFWLCYIAIILFFAIPFLDRKQTTSPQATRKKTPVVTYGVAVHNRTYSWEDYHGKHHDIQTSVKQKDLLAGIAGYGIEDQGLQQALQAEAKRLARQYGVDEVEVKPSSRGRWSYQWRGRLHSQTKSQFDTLLRDSLRRTEEKYYRDQAIRREIIRQKNILLPDYALLAERHRPALADFILKLNAATAGMNRLQKTDTILSLVQSLRYEIPPEVVKGRETLGLFTPVEVAVYQKGDCDSKSLFYATLWGKTNPAEIVLVSVPGHMLLGVRGLHATRKDQTTIKLGGVDYLLCESTKPGWFPGVIPEEIQRHIREGRADVFAL